MLLSCKLFFKILLSIILSSTASANSKITSLSKIVIKKCCNNYETYDFETKTCVSNVHNSNNYLFMNIIQNHFGKLSNVAFEKSTVDMSNTTKFSNITFYADFIELENNKIRVSSFKE